MPKLFHRGEWFYELSPSALAEAEFERLLIQNADLICKDARIIPFKKTVHAPDGSARADLAIIDTDYRYWIVVEVEMIRHSLMGHVLPQVRSLREGSYRQEHAEYMARMNTELSMNKLGDMLRGDPPEVLVLVNKYDDEWRRELNRWGANMMVLEIYRSDRNRTIFSVDGEPPQYAENIVSELSFGLLPRCLSVASPAVLNFAAGERVAIFIDDKMTFWERFETATNVFLTPVGSMPIFPGPRYVLTQDAAGAYVIRALDG